MYKIRKKKLFPLGLLGCKSIAIGTHFAYCVLRTCLQNETKQDKLSQEIQTTGTEMDPYHIICNLDPAMPEASCISELPVMKVTDFLFWFNIILVGLLSLIIRCSDLKSPNSSSSPKSSLTQKEDFPLSVNENIIVPIIVLSIHPPTYSISH